MKAADAAVPYHHGDLRRALLDAAVESIEESGPALLSLRDLSRRVGVSHAAPAHHFRDKTGLLTALAVEGYLLLSAELGRTWEGTHDFLEVGVAYVRFAVGHPAHFAVMYRPDLVDFDDPDLANGRAASRSFLYGPAGEVAGGDALTAGIAGWSLMHGLATLWLNGTLPPQAGQDPEAIARAAGRHLFG